MKNRFSRLPLLRSCLGLLLTGWAMTSPAVLTAAAPSPQPVETLMGSGISIKICSIFDNAPNNGVVPLLVTIENNSGHAGEWSIRSMGERHEAETTLFVETGQTRQSVLLVKTAGRHAGSNPKICVDGPGTVGDYSYCSRYSTNYYTGTICAMSSAIEAQSRKPLEALSKSTSSAIIATFDPLCFIADWRAYTSFSVIILAEQEWSGLQLPVRAALGQWVAAGGRLIIASQTPQRVSWAPFFSSPASTPAAPFFRYGMGELHAVTWDGAKVAPETLNPLLSASKSRGGNGGLALAEAPTYPLGYILGELTPNRLLLGLVVLLFAALAGPVNLYCFAPATHRARLFWTTPLLSLGVSLILLGIVIFQDGFGGTGQRTLLIELFPQNHEALVVQDQYSRTGFLLGSSFQVDEPALLLASTNNTQQSPHYVEKQTRQGLICSGDWFASRSLQTQRLLFFRPTRAEVTLLGSLDNASPGNPASTPQVVSSIAGTLRCLIVSDSKGELWMGEFIDAGKKTPLRKITRQEKGSVQTLMEPASSPINTLVEKRFPLLNEKQLSKLQPGRFLALLDSSSPTKESVETLHSIRWKPDHVLYTGLLSMASQQPLPSTQP